jgi:hypothetical protein
VGNPAPSENAAMSESNERCASSLSIPPAHHTEAGSYPIFPPRKATHERQVVDPFTRAYIEAALWSSTAHSPDQPDSDAAFDSAGYTIEDLAPETFDAMLTECRDFQQQQANLLCDAGSDEQNGHDFWLTRNRHGVGFWDRGYGVTGRLLTEAVEAAGPRNLYLGDDDQVYQL